MRRHVAYLKYVARHKWFVFRAGRKTHAPLWRLLVHDWSKFLPSEWLPYARTFYKSDGSKQYVESPEFNAAWLKHIHRNPHHWQHWVLVRDNPDARYCVQDDGAWQGNTQIWDSASSLAAKIHITGPRPAEEMVLDLIRKAERGVALPMPLPLIREMVADWAGAGRAITGRWEVKTWYEKNKLNMEMHDYTRTHVELLLEVWHE